MNPLSRYHPDNIAKAATAAAEEAKTQERARAALAQIEKNINAGGLTPEQRVIVMARVREKMEKDFGSSFQSEGLRPKPRKFGLPVKTMSYEKIKWM